MGGQKGRDLKAKDIFFTELAGDDVVEITKAIAIKRQNSLRGKMWRHAEEQNDKCYYCECKLTKKNITADHKIPTSKSGTDDYKNIVAACFSCNRDKGDMTVKDYMQFVKQVKDNG